MRKPHANTLWAIQASGYLLVCIKLHDGPGRLHPPHGIWVHAIIGNEYQYCARLGLSTSYYSVLVNSSANRFY